MCNDLYMNYKYVYVFYYNSGLFSISYPNFKIMADTYTNRVKP